MSVTVFARTDLLQTRSSIMLSNIHSFDHIFYMINPYKKNLKLIEKKYLKKFYVLIIESLFLFKIKKSLVL
jgi:hypothetical protein